MPVAMGHGHGPCFLHACNTAEEFPPNGGPVQKNRGPQGTRSTGGLLACLHFPPSYCSPCLQRPGATTALNRRPHRDHIKPDREPRDPAALLQKAHGEAAGQHATSPSTVVAPLTAQNQTYTTAAAMATELCTPHPQNRSEAPVSPDLSACAGCTPSNPKSIERQRSYSTAGVGHGLELQGAGGHSKVLRSAMALFSPLLHW